MVMRKIMLIVCLMTAIAVSAQENWEDSVKVYRDQARNGDVNAYEKLATCYHEGKGVKHNFHQILWIMMMADEQAGELVSAQFFYRLPENDIDRVMFEAYEALFNENLPAMRDVIQRLMVLDQGAGEMMEGILSRAENKYDDAIKHFTKALELGYDDAEAYLLPLQNPYSLEDHVNALLRLAEDYPMYYNFLGGIMASSSKEDPEKKELAIHYYKLSDEYACLNDEGRAFLKNPDRDPNDLSEEDMDRLEMLTGIGLTNRYGVIVSGEKYGIRDYEKNEDVTEMIYDYARPAFRKEVDGDYITFVEIKVDGQSGLVGIIEETNEIITKMFDPKEE